MITFVAVFALIMAYVALVAGYLALRTLARLRRASAVLARGGDGNESLIEATQRHIELTELVAAQHGSLRTYVDSLRSELSGRINATSRDLTHRLDALDPRGALRNVSLVRYDAFNVMSGRMSFSLAMLDDAGDGITISAIAGATDTRVYAKGVLGWQGEHELTPEEQQAVKAAMKYSRHRRKVAAGKVSHRDLDEPITIEPAEDEEEAQLATQASQPTS